MELEKRSFISESHNRTEMGKLSYNIKEDLTTHGSIAESDKPWIKLEDAISTAGIQLRTGKFHLLEH